jgi:hypothetical protein
MIRVSNPTIFGGGFQAPSRVTLPVKPSLGQATSGRLLEAKASLDEAVRNRDSVEREIKAIEFIVGPEATVKALDEAEASVMREQGSYRQTLAEERRS